MKRVLSFDQLEEFECYNFGLNNQDLYDILSRYPSIMKLKLEMNDFIVDPLELATVLPKLAEIDLRCRMGPSPVDDPIIFIRKIKSLKKFSFRYNTAGKPYEDLLKRLPTGWHVTKIHDKLPQITIEQKI